MWLWLAGGFYHLFYTPDLVEHTPTLHTTGIAVFWLVTTFHDQQRHKCHYISLLHATRSYVVSTFDASETEN